MLLLRAVTGVFSSAVIKFQNEGAWLPLGGSLIAGQVFTSSGAVSVLFWIFARRNNDRKAFDGIMSRKQGQMTRICC